LPSIALKKADTEAPLATQFAVSTVFAVFLMIVLLLLSSNQQLNGIFVRLQHMADGTGAPLTGAADDIALFVRALLIAYLIVCDSADTFKQLPDKSMAGVFVNALPTLRDYGLGIRNSASLLFIVWAWLLDVARMVVPAGIFPFVVLELADLLHLFLGVVTVEALLHDMTVTNMACTALVGCDGCFVLYGVVYRVYGEIQARQRAPARQGAPDTQKTPGVYDLRPAARLWSADMLAAPAARDIGPARQRPTDMLAAPAAHDVGPPDGIELTFNAPGINEISLNWGTFEKKIK
jgi:hypothetical protein